MSEQKTDDVLWGMAQALYTASGGDIEADSEEMRPVLEVARVALSPKPDRPMLSDERILSIAGTRPAFRNLAVMDALDGDEVIALVHACIRADREGQP